MHVLREVLLRVCKGGGEARRRGFENSLLRDSESVTFVHLPNKNAELLKIHSQNYRTKIEAKHLGPVARDFESFLTVVVADSQLSMAHGPRRWQQASKGLRGVAGGGACVLVTVTALPLNSECIFPLSEPICCLTLCAHA
jgi:hypothetical protein